MRERQAELLRERSPPLAAIEDSVSALHQFLVGTVRHKVCHQSVWTSSNNSCALIIQLIVMATALLFIM